MYRWKTSPIVEAIKDWWAILKKIVPLPFIQPSPQIAYLYNPGTNVATHEGAPSGGPPLPTGQAVAECLGEPTDVITISGTGFGTQAGDQCYVILVDASGGEWVSDGGPQTVPNLMEPPMHLSASATLPGVSAVLLDKVPYYKPGAAETIPGSPSWSETLLAIEVPSGGLRMVDGPHKPYVTVTANGQTSTPQYLQLALGT